MAPPIFASADIAVLVANFPPPLPTRTTHSLLLSKAGSNLSNSQKVLSRFQRLVESRDAGDTIKLKDLPAILNVRDTDWLLDCYNGTLRFTRDGGAIITSPRFEDVMSTLAEDSKGFVTLDLFAARYDVSIDSFHDRDLERWGLCRVPASSLPGENAFICPTQVLESICGELRELIEGEAVVEEVDLSQRLPDVPKLVLRSVVEDLKARGDNIPGEFEDRDDRIVFVPLAFTAAQQEGRKAAYDAEVQKLLQHLGTQGYAHVPPEFAKDSDMLLKDVASKYSSNHTSVEAEMATLQIDDGTKAIVAQIRLDEMRNEIERALDGYMRSEDYDGDQAILEKAEEVLFSMLDREDVALARLLVRSQYRDDLHGVIASKANEIESEKRERFDRLFQETVMAPLHLYSAAIFGDATLKQNQDAFLTSYFRQQVIPGFVAAARREELLSKSSDDGRLRDMNELGELCKEQPPDSKIKSLKTFKDLQLAVTKFAKRQKIPAPSTEQISKVLHETLRQKIKAIEKMQRPSDILQNVLWIGLSQAVDEGLFMSSGKDTSRMIEQYRVAENGKSEVWRKLVDWRDGIKSGRVSEEGMKEMKELAREIVGEMGVVEVDSAVEQ